MDNPYYRIKNHTITSSADANTTVDTTTAITTATVSKADLSEEEEFASSSLQWDPRDTVSVITNTTAMSTKDALLHRLHYNERQLRTLAVVLSLTGGLALSFALGVGIMIYWYTRKCKKQQRKKNRKKNVKTNSNSSCCDSNKASRDVSSDSQSLNIINTDVEEGQRFGEEFCTGDYHRTSAPSTVDEATNEIVVEATTTACRNGGNSSAENTNVSTTGIVSNRNPSPSYHCLQSQISSTFTSDDIILSNYNNTSSLLSELMLLPPIPASTSSLPLPEPSAPSAKEIQINDRRARVDDAVNNNAHAPQTSSAQGHHFCQECYMPPPAYSEAAAELTARREEEEQPAQPELA